MILRKKLFFNERLVEENEVTGYIRLYRVSDGHAPFLGPKFWTGRSAPCSCIGKFLEISGYAKYFYLLLGCHTVRQNAILMCQECENRFCSRG